MSPLARVGTADFIFAVHPKVPANTIEELNQLRPLARGGRGREYQGRRVMKFARGLSRCQAVPRSCLASLIW